MKPKFKLESPYAKAKKAKLKSVKTYQKPRQWAFDEHPLSLRAQVFGSSLNKETFKSVRGELCGVQYVTWFHLKRWSRPSLMLNRASESASGTMTLMKCLKTLSVKRALKKR